MIVTFPDGSSRTFDGAATPLDIASSISPRLAKATLACEVDGKVCDAFRPIGHDCAVKFLSFEDEGGRSTFRHTASHVLAQAVKRLHPEIKLAIGPSIENGFYYDFDAPQPFTPEDLAAIEKEMVKIEKEP